MTTPEALANVVDRLCRIAHSLQFAQGLNPAQWEALRYIGCANKYSTTPGVLAEYMGTTKGTVSQTLIALESKGLLERVRCATDRRKVRLSLTEAGREMLANDPICRIRAAIAELSDLERNGLHSAVTAMVEGLCANGLKEGSSFGVCGDCCHLDRADSADACAGACRCGLTGEPLAPAELRQICVSFDVAKT